MPLPHRSSRTVWICRAVAAVAVVGLIVLLSRLGETSGGAWGGAICAVVAVVALVLPYAFPLAPSDDRSGVQASGRGAGSRDSGAIRVMFIGGEIAFIGVGFGGIVWGVRLLLDHEVLVGVAVAGVAVTGIGLGVAGLLDRVVVFEIAFIGSCIVCVGAAYLLVHDPVLGRAAEAWFAIALIALVAIVVPSPGDASTRILDFLSSRSRVKSKNKKPGPARRRR